MEPSPATIRVELDLDVDALVRDASRNYDGEPRDHGLVDMILQRTADALLKRAIDRATDDKWYDDLGSRVKAVRDEQIEAALAPLIEQALERAASDATPMRAGDDRTLGEYIVGRAEETLKRLQQPRDSWARQQPVIDRLIGERVTEVMRREFRQALDEEKAKVKQAVRDEGAKALSDALERIAKGSVL